MIFRAKDLDGNFVYGLPVYDENKSMTKMFLENQEIVDIRPETLGIGTGITDKNGNPMFVGDIVLSKVNGKPPIRYKVCWSESETQHFRHGGAILCLHNAVYFRRIHSDGTVDENPLFPAIEDESQREAGTMEVIYEQ